MPDRRAAENSGPLACLTAAPADGWQVIVAEGTAPAQSGLDREHDVAGGVSAGTSGPAIFIWRSQPALIVARSQTRWPGFAAAAASLGKIGWPVLLRGSGGGAFPIGPGTVQIAMTARHPALGALMEEVYGRLGSLIGSALTEFGIAAGAGHTPGAFCEGRHDLVFAGRKIAGLAQHWRLCGRGGGRCVIAGASVLVDVDVAELVGIVDRFHALCGQTIALRADALTTVRDNCGAISSANGDLPGQFLRRLAAAARRTVRDLS